MSDKKEGGSPPVRSRVIKSLSTTHHTGTLGKPGGTQGGQGGNNQSGGDSGGSSGGSQQQSGGKTEGDK